MPTYQIILFLHILGAFGFFIAIGVFYLAVFSVRRAENVQSLRIWTGAAASVSRVLFPISSVVLLVAGIYMVVTVWGERAPWAGVALLAFLILAVGATLIQGRQMAVLGQRAATQPESELVTGVLWVEAHDAVTWVSVNASATFAIGIVYLMTLKPDALGSVIALLIALTVGIVFGILTQGRPTAAPMLAKE